MATIAEGRIRAAGRGQGPCTQRVSLKAIAPGSRGTSASRGIVTYCLGIVTDEGLVMASDSRSNAGFDQVNVCRKMHRFVSDGERVFVILTSGSLSISQSVISLLRVDFEAGIGLAQAPSLYHAARIVGETVRRVSEIDRAPLERDNFSFNVNLLLGGQVRDEPPTLYLIYPQGNPLQATEDSPYLQLGEVKYGRPILDRGIQTETSLEVAAKYALLSFDATMRSNVTVGPPIDLLLYKRDSLRITRYRRLGASDPDLNLIHASWEQSLRRAVEQLPEIEFAEPPEPIRSDAVAPEGRPGDREPEPVRR
jgi:putative proteasome-type protease